MSQRLSDLIDRLQQAGLEVNAEDLADILWLAQQIQAADDRPSESIAPEPLEINPRQPQPKPKKQSSESSDSEPAAEVTLPPSVDSQPSTDQPSQSTPNRTRGLPFRAPAAPALRQVRQLEKALRPLARKVDSHHTSELDEAATVEQSADLDWWLAVLRPARERWLDVALVVEQSPAIDLWRSLVEDWQALLGRSGAFRDVRVWWLREESGQIAIAPHPNGPVSSPRQLLDPSGRRLILFMSDCTSGLWRSHPAVDDHSSNEWPANSLQAVLKLWAAKGALTLVQWLPEWLWRRTALGAAYWVQLSATMPGQASDRLSVSGLPVWEDVETAGSLRLPVVTIEPGPLARWARLVAGAGDALSAGVLFEPGTVWQPSIAAPNDRPDPEMIVRQFWAVASPLAKQLAGYMAAVPVSWEVLHLIQAALLPESNQVHGAEVFMGGLMERVGNGYDFREGVRSWLVDSMPRSQTEKVLDAVSDQIAKRFGITARGFRALLFDSADLPEGAIAEVQAFARIARSTLLRMGGEFAALGDRLDAEIIRTAGRVGAEISAQEMAIEAFSESAIDFPPLTEATEENYFQQDFVQQEWGRQGWGEFTQVSRPFPSIVQLKHEFDPSRPLEPGDPAYVDCSSVRGDDDITVDLGRTITDAQRKTCQIYSGHRGSGKSTELKKLKQWLEDRGFFVVYFAAATEDAGDLNLKDTKCLDILLACTRNIIGGLKSLEGLDSQPIAQWIDKLVDDLKTILLADIKIEDLKTNVELQLSQLDKLTTAARLEPQKRDQVRKLMRDRTESLEMALNDLLANARRKLPPGKRDLVVIVDNLDRISPVDRADGRTNRDEIFLDHAYSLRSLNCHTIYTAPISFVLSASASRLRDEYDGVERLPMVAIADRDHQMLNDGYAKLRDVLTRRVAKAAPGRSLVPDVFADEAAVQRLCVASGGHMRELMRLVQESLKQTDVLPISLKTVQRVITEARETYLDAIRFEDWKALMAVEQTKDSRNDYEDRCRNLSLQLCVLEYREWDEETEDKITWAAVHPLIRSSKEFKQRWEAFQTSSYQAEE